MAHDVMLVSVCIMSGGLGAAESALNLSVQAKLHIDLHTQGLGSVITGLRKQMSLHRNIGQSHRHRRLSSDPAALVDDAWALSVWSPKIGFMHFEGGSAASPPADHGSTSGQSKNA